MASGFQGMCTPRGALRPAHSPVPGEDRGQCSGPPREAVSGAGRQGEAHSPVPERVSEHCVPHDTSLCCALGTGNRKHRPSVPPTRPRGM